MSLINNLKRIRQKNEELGFLNKENQYTVQIHEEKQNQLQQIANFLTNFIWIIARANQKRCFLGLICL